MRLVEESTRACQDALRQAQSDAFSAAQELTRARNELTALDLQKQGNVVRLEKLSAEKIQLEEERSRLEAANLSPARLPTWKRKEKKSDSPIFVTFIRTKPPRF